MYHAARIKKMKLHLPSALRKALLAVTVVSMTVAVTTQAAIMHPSVSLQTYTDFGSNMGRYTIYQQNELLQHLNKDGVRIIYTQGEAPYQLGQKMISYESMVDGGPFTAISYNATATVRHNGVTNPVFTGRFIGSDQAIHYAGIEYRSCENNTFLLTPEIDYKITRLSKIITDITPSSLYDARAHKLKGEDIGHMLQYRAGGGYMQQADETGKTTWLTGAYTYVVGGIVTNSGFGYSRGYDYIKGEGKKDVRGITDDSYTVTIIGVSGWEAGTAGTSTHPLPFVTQGGDSGSPVWVWNQESQAYELLSCHQARGSYDSYSRGASEWTKETLKSFCVGVDMDAANHEVHIGKVQQTDSSETIAALANGSTHASTTTKYGSVYSENGAVDEEFIGIEHGKNTWLNLSDLKDGQITDDAGKTKDVNWYAYGNEYLNATNTAASDLQYADLFMTENLVFEATGSNNKVILDDTVDLGIGYARFTTKGGSASYTIESVGDKSSQFNHAGYIIDKDVDVHVTIANREVESGTGKDYFREWRKTGEGNLYLEGTGDNHIFLNVGGKGTTFLREQGNGYAAYNVLINNGATVNLGGNINQVERDVTFGYGGGVLDFYGTTQMDWRITSPGAQQGAGFTISALTQDAIIANTASGTTTTLTYKADKDTTFLGSFWDGTIKDENGQYIHQQNAGTLKVVYAGEANTTWTLNSIHTKLSGDSGLEVNKGKVVLVGTLTEHAQGSLTGFNQNRYSNEDDWHYADAKMNVTVDSGATFELGSHARLTGNVTVQDKGTFLMREGVRHEMEYIEGWYELENTCTEEIRKYYGLHGNVNLESGSQMQVQFSEKTDANTTLKGSISGSGSMVVNTGKGTLTLAGDNSGFSGSKQLDGGALILHNMDAAGNVNANKWKLSESSWMTIENTDADTALNAVDKASKGVLALSQNESGDAVSLAEFKDLILGAKQGSVIQFGKESGEQREYAAVGGKWNLGGGGGNLVVNYALKGDGDLVLGNAFTEGKVTLTNKQNDIKDIHFGGKVTLDYDSIAALGGATVHLDYTNRIVGNDADGEKTIDRIGADSSGVMLLDKMEDLANIDLGGHEQLYLGVSKDITYSGDFTLGEDGSYKFGGCTATLTLTEALKDQVYWGSNLYIDAQGYTGGVVELKKALEITGGVIIMGQEEERQVNGGEITLKLNEADSLAKTAGIMLTEGGKLDINGYNQTLYYIDASAGSYIIDSSKGKKGTLTIGYFLYSNMGGVVDVGSLVLDVGVGNHMYLRGENIYRDFDIKSGVVHMESQQALCATGRTVLEEDASMTITDCTVTTNLELQGSTVTLGEEGEIGHLAGALSVADGTTGTVNFAVDGSTLSAVVDTGKGGTLKLTGNRGTVSSPLVNADGSEEDVSGEHESGGTVIVELKELRLAGSGSTIGGELKLKGQDNNLTLRSQTYGNNMQREINHLDLQDDLNLTITEQSYNTIWNFHKLSGKGNITWKSGTVHWFSSRIVLDGSNSFEGTFTAERTDVDKQGRHYGTFVELAHDEALQNATLIMHGKETTEGKSMMTLAVNTDNAKLRGLIGDEYTAIYAGASIEGESKSGGPLKIAPSSVRSAKLTITGGGAYDFKGNVYGGEDDTHNGLDIVMDGIGIQNFSGREVTVNSVTAKQGKLVLSADSLTIKDRATIYRGATLGTGNNEFTLGPNMALMVAGSGSGAAQLDSVLSLDGGSIGFEGTSINTSEYALSVQGVNKNGQTELDIIFESTASLQQNTEYKLASGGEWEGIAYHSNNLEYYDAAFNAQNEGLTVTFTLKKDNNIWLGSKDKSTWDDNNFGISPEVPGEGKTTVFNDLAESRDVQVQGQQHAAKLLFDSTQEYEVSGTGEDASLAANSLLQIGSGTTKLGSGVHINGTADVQSGTLELLAGSTTDSIQVDAQGTVIFKDNRLETGFVSGDGTLRVDWGAEKSGQLLINSVGNLSVESGTVQIDSSASVTQSLTIAENANLHMQGAPEWGGSISLEVDGTLAFTAAQGNVDLSAASGKGRVELSTTNDYKNEVKVGQGDSFAGTTNMKGGRLDLNKSSFGKTLEVENTVEMLMHTQVDFESNVIVTSGATLRIFQDSSGGTALLNINGTLSGNGTYERRGVAPLEVNGEVKLHKFVQANDTERNPGTNFNNVVSLDELVANSGSVHFNKSASFGSAEVNGGIVDIRQSATITDTMKLINGNSSVSIRHVEGGDGAVISGAVAFGNNGDAIAINGADGSRIENSIIDLAAGTRLEMANVTLGANSRITDDTAVLVANGLVLDADIRANLMPLTYGDAVASPAAEPADMVCLTLSNIQDVLIEGRNTGLVVNMVGDSSRELDGAEWLQLGLGKGDLKGRFADGLNVTLLYEDATGQQLSAQGVYTLEDVEAQAAAEEATRQYDYVYFRITGTVPEPATGTLSLLALAALAARRRRK